MLLTVQEYDQAELEAKIGLSFTEIMAFAPRTFDNLGFPHRVVDERELVRYADWNRDAENQHYFRPGGFSPGPAVRTDYTPDEVDAMNRVRDQAVEATRKLGRAVRPLCSPFAALGLFRILAAIGLPGLRVFEVGPGTGYLGAMLVNSGLDFYLFTDNSQALFLWQNRMFAEVSRNRIDAVPWWRFASKLGQTLPKVDVVVSNANLAEMTPTALKIVAHRAKQMLDGSALGLLLFSNFGSQSQNTNDGVHAALERAGFRRVFDRLFQGYVVGGHQMPFDPAPLQADIPLYNPSGRPGTVSGAEAVSIPANQRPLDLDVMKMLGEWEPPA